MVAVGGGSIGAFVRLGLRQDGPGGLIGSLSVAHGILVTTGIDRISGVFNLKSRLYLQEFARTSKTIVVNREGV